MNIFKGTFTGAVATGNQAITGVGFLPTGIFVWFNNSSAAGYSDGVNYGIGLADGTNSIAIAGNSSDNVATTVTRRASNASRFIDIYTGAATLLARATFVSLDSDGFTINWSTVDGTAPIFHYIAFGGCNIQVGTFGEEGSYNVDPITTFKAEGFLLFSTGNNVSYALTTAFNTANIGFAANQTGNYNQGLSAIGIRNNVATSDTDRYQRTVQAAGNQATVPGTMEIIWGYGANLGFRSITSNVQICAFMAIGGIQAKVGNLLQPLATGTQAITGVGFQPKLVLFSSVGQTAQTTVQAEAKLSIGAGDGTRQGLSWIGDTNAVSPSVNAKRHVTTKVITMSTPNATGGSSTTEAEADLQSLDADGFTLNWTTADAVAREVIYIAIGDAGSAPAGSSGGSYAFA